MILTVDLLLAHGVPYWRHVQTHRVANCFLSLLTLARIVHLLQCGNDSHLFLPHIGEPSCFAETDVTFSRPLSPPLLFAQCLSRTAAETIKIGLVTALSGQSALSGEAITRGLSVAIDEINAKGGLLGGRKLELVRRDDEGNPTKGVTGRARVDLQGKGRRDFRRAGYTRCQSPSCAWPIKRKYPSWGPWAAGTPITKNGVTPNFAFRVSAVDEIVDRGMLGVCPEDLQDFQAGDDSGQ